MMSDLAGLSEMPDMGDSEVVAVLVENNRVFRKFLARRMGTTADVEDVLQDFCLKALSRQDQHRPSDNLVAWLYSILRSCLSDHYRKTERRGKISKAFALETESGEQVAGADQLHKNLCKCLHSLLPVLRPDYAELVRRIDLAEEERAEVAADIGISAGTLAVRLHRARQVLKRALLTSCGSCVEHGFDDCGCDPANHQVRDTVKRP
ncbi:hypothetical protein MNBD_ALPHA08-1264 [hydrothermal vent metagenome]|uniref:Uncharacterized protein n=1 Tax=hydrothermal vent metagenome TaxID=652676 RepID=A0A3B0SFL1_9ZZZZ